MCAIAGIFSKDKDIESAELEKMCGRMNLRGPDAGGVYVSGQVGLGHRRLSIIDLGTGDQPMFNNDRSAVIVFNGEIYNFRELRVKLEEAGQVFRTQSDTEVILNAYRVYGMEKTVCMLEGMFAFALYDIETKELYIARDKFGEKPLYVWDQGEQLCFASELKAFAPDLSRFKIDYKALNYFLALDYIPAPYTIYQEIRKMMPGYYWRINAKGEKEEKCYFDLKESIPGENNKISFEEAQHKLRDLLTESVKRRMVSDVPMGAFLSGGVDSSIICTLMSQLSDRPVNTFSIGFKEKDYDESERARLVAEHIGANHTEYILDYKDVVKELDAIIAYYDEPFGDSSAIPSFYVAKLAREKVKVVLTGDCADELFAGYEKYLGRYYVERYRKLPTWVKSCITAVISIIPYTSFTNNFLRKIKKVIDNAESEDFDLYYHLMSLGFQDEERKKLLCPEIYRDIKPEIKEKYDSFSELSVLGKEQCTDVQVVLEGDMFVKIDRACMKSSLENRAPFIDSGILEFALQLPPDYRLKGKSKKYILKETFKDILPRWTSKFSKRGFGVPVDYWFRNELKGKLEEVLRREFLESQGIFNYDAVQTLLLEHLSGRENHKTRLWNLYVFQRWYLNNKNME